MPSKQKDLNISGAIIRKRREFLKMTQAQLAERIDCSQSNIMKLEGGSVPDIRLGTLLARHLGLTVEEIFFATEVPDQIGNENQLASNTPKNVQALAEVLLNLPEEKLNALSVLVGVKFSVAA